MKIEVGMLVEIVDGPDHTHPDCREYIGYIGRVIEYNESCEAWIIEGIPLNSEGGYRCFITQHLRPIPPKRQNNDITETKESNYPGGWDTCLWQPEKVKI